MLVGTMFGSTSETLTASLATVDTTMEVVGGTAVVTSGGHR